MKSLYIASTQGGGGKTTLAVGLCLAFRARGIDAGYFRPVGVAGEGDGDADSAFAAELLDPNGAAADLCPVTVDEQALRIVSDSRGDPMGVITAAYGRAAAAHELLVCDGLGEIWQGRFLRLGGEEIVATLDLRALLVSKFAGTRELDDVCYSNDVLKGRLLGVVFTMVPDTRLDVVEHRYAPVLQDNGVRTFGVIPFDARLSAVAVGEIATALQGRFVLGEEWASAMADAYLIGAMSPEHARRHFERAANAVVVVGGDREDLILVALETSARAVILTGEFVPGAAVLERAREAGVPLIATTGDTAAVADGLRRLFGRLRVHERDKIARMTQLIEERIDLDGLLTALR